MPDSAPHFRLHTFHGTDVFVDTATERLRHGVIEDNPDVVLAALNGTRLTLYWQRPGHGPEALCFGPDGETVAPGEPQVFEIEPVEEVFGLRNDGKYLCAELDGRVVHNREVRGDWERFTLIAVPPAAEPAPDPTLAAYPVSAPIGPPLAEPEPEPEPEPELEPEPLPPPQPEPEPEPEPAVSPMPQPSPVAEGGAPLPPPPPPVPTVPTGWTATPPTPREGGFWRRVKRALFGGG